MNNILRTFYNNEVEREAVRGFMVETLGQIAIERAFGGEATQGIQEARECINKMFDKLEELYDIIKAPVIINSR